LSVTSGNRKTRPPTRCGQILEPQSETVRTGLAELFGCDREEIAITRNASESLETLLHGNGLSNPATKFSHDSGLPRACSPRCASGETRKPQAQAHSGPIPAKNLNEITAAFEKGITARTRLILISHMINITGQITPVKAVCDLARARGIETVVDGAHSFAPVQFQTERSRLRLLRHESSQMVVRAERHGMLYVKRDKIEKLWPLMAAESKQADDIRKFEEMALTRPRRSSPSAKRLCFTMR
jgi:selenocysteine lyase/cysteine desulfurase